MKRLPTRDSLGRKIPIGLAARRQLRKAKSKSCRCRAPRRHRDCMYCGSGWAGEVICGICKEQGIDGKLIPGTGRVCCASHKKGS